MEVDISDIYEVRKSKQKIELTLVNHLYTSDKAGGFQMYFFFP